MARLYILSREELKALTGKTWRRKQCEELAAMGVPFRTTSDGWPVVSRDAATKCLNQIGLEDYEGEATLNWAALEPQKR